MNDRQVLTPITEEKGRRFYYFEVGTETKPLIIQLEETLIKQSSFDAARPLTWAVEGTGVIPCVKPG